MNDRAIAMDRCVKGWELLRCACGRLGADPSPRPSPGGRGGLICFRHRIGDRVRVCARAVDRTRPHPGPLPAGEGV